MPAIHQLEQADCLQQHREDNSPYAELAQLCAASGAVSVGTTACGGRGLLLRHDLPEREAALAVPLHNALTIADDPISGISIFSDVQHRRWQELHGPLPPLLLDFLQSA